MNEQGHYAVEEIHPDGRRTLRWPRRPGWWLLTLVAWDALVQRVARPAHCTYCGELLHRDGYCTPYPDPPGKPGVASKREDLI